MVEWLTIIGAILVTGGPFGLLFANIFVEGHRSEVRQRVLDDLMVGRGWIRLPGRMYLDAGQLSGSVLAAFRMVFEATRVLGKLNGQLFVLSEITVDRPTHFFSAKLTVAEFEMRRQAPHILIVPRGSRFIGRGSLKHEYHLRPLELEGRAARLYVPEGFEVEALEVLEPDVWEALERERVVVELSGSSARFMWPNYLPPEHALASLERAAKVVETLYGVAPGELVGPQAPELVVSPVVRGVSNVTVKQLIIGGAFALGGVCVWLLLWRDW